MFGPCAVMPAFSGWLCPQERGIPSRAARQVGEAGLYFTTFLCTKSKHMERKPSPQAR